MRLRTRAVVWQAAVERPPAARAVVGRAVVERPPAARAVQVELQPAVMVETGRGAPEAGARWMPQPPVAPQGEPGAQAEAQPTRGGSTAPHPQVLAAFPERAGPKAFAVEGRIASSTARAGRRAFATAREAQVAQQAREAPQAIAPRAAYQVPVV